MSSASILLMTAFLLFGPSGCARAQEFQIPPAWLEPQEPFEIGESLYYVGSADLTAFLFTSDEGHILIDVPMEQNVEMVLANIRKLGFDPADIEIQLASHGHFDHTGGIGPMLEVTGAELVLSPPAAALIGAGGKGDFHLGDRAAYPPARAARTVGHLETVTVGDWTLTAHITPGHTKGCTSWSGELKIARESASFVSICSLSVLPGYRLVGDNPSYDGIGRDFCTSVAHLRSLDANVFLASHGRFIGMGAKLVALGNGDAKAFIDPEGYTAYLDRAEQKIQKTLEDQGHEGGCASLLAKG